MLRKLAERRMYKIAAFLTILYIRKIKLGKIEVAPKYKILCLSKRGFNEDILSSFGDSPEFMLYSIPRKIIKAVSFAFLPPEITDFNYITTNPKIEKQKKLYRNFLVKMWMIIKNKMQFDAVLSGNFVYYAERELATALTNIKLPFIVLYKESLKSPGITAIWEKINREQRGVFTGKKMLVYNIVERQLQIKSGVSSTEQIVVTGMPRLDRVHKWRTKVDKVNINKSPQILFFSFNQNKGLPNVNSESLKWTNLYRNCFKTIIKIARDNSDIHVVIKMKDDKNAISEMQFLTKQYAMTTCQI